MPTLAQQPHLLDPLIVDFPVEFETFLKSKALTMLDSVRPNFSNKPIIGKLYYKNMGVIALYGQEKSISVSEFKVHIEALMQLINTIEAYELLDIWLLLARIRNCYYLNMLVDEFENYVAALMQVLKNPQNKTTGFQVAYQPENVSRESSINSVTEVEGSPLFFKDNFLDTVVLFLECRNEPIEPSRLLLSNYYYLVFLLFSHIYKNITQLTASADVDCNNEQSSNLRHCLGRLSKELEFEVSKHASKPLAEYLLEKLKEFVLDLKPNSLKLIKAYTIARLGVFYIEMLLLHFSHEIVGFATVLAFIVTKINSCVLSISYRDYGIFVDNVSTALTKYIAANNKVQVAADGIDTELHNLILVDHSVKMNVVAILQVIQINFSEESRLFPSFVSTIEALTYNNDMTDELVLKAIINNLNTLLLSSVISILFKLVLTAMLIWACLAYEKSGGVDKEYFSILVNDVLHFIKYIHKTFHLHSLYNSFDPKTTEVTAVQKTLLKMNVEAKVKSMSYYQRLKGFLVFSPPQQAMVIDGNHILYKIFVWQMHNKNPFGSPYDDQGKWGYQQTLTDCDRQQVYINGVHLYPLIGDLKQSNSDSVYAEMNRRLSAMTFQQLNVQAGKWEKIKLQDWQVNFCLNYAAVQGIYEFANYLFGSLPFFLTNTFQMEGAIKQSDKVTEIRILDENTIQLDASICIEGLNDGEKVHAMNPAIVIKSDLRCEMNDGQAVVTWRKFEITGVEQNVQLPELRVKEVQPSMMGLWNSPIYYTWRDVLTELHDVCHECVSRPLHDRGLTTARQRSQPNSPVKWGTIGQETAVPSERLTNEKIKSMSKINIHPLQQLVTIQQPQRLDFN
tara:strand:- start:735 stop:3275 length:2541 start_codon:yes stop_codon:yes gene_type:complete